MFRELLLCRFGDSKIDDFRNECLFMLLHQDVGRLEIAVNDSFLMGMLHSSAHFDEQFDSLANIELLIVAEFGDGQALHKFHDEVRAALFCCAAIQYASDVGMIHHCQGLTLGLKSGYDLARIHPGLNHLERHSPAHRRFLFGHINRSHSTLSDLLQDRVTANFGARFYENKWIASARVHRRGIRKMNTSHGKVCVEEFLDLIAKRRVIATDFVKKFWPLIWRFA